MSRSALTSAALLVVVLLSAGLASAPAPAAADFIKLRRQYVPREAVWFNGREGDLEKHAIRRDGQLCITATDLLRHVGGTMVWGPGNNWVEVHRGDNTLRLIPGSRQVLLNGQSHQLLAPAARIAGNTWIPAANVCHLLGIAANWNADEQRLYVTYKP
ncbi:MAG TPA: stalk domain-containing protein [Armatimonadota bacterium]|jgi:hypothetical protein